MFISYRVEQGPRQARVVQHAGRYEVQGYTRYVDETWQRLAAFERTKPLENLSAAKARAEKFITDGLYGDEVSRG